MKGYYKNQKATDETIIDDPVDVNPLQPLINQAKAEKIESEAKA